MVAGPPRGVEGRAGGRPRRTEMLTGEPPFEAWVCRGGPGRGSGTAGRSQAGPRAGPGRGRWIGREGEVLPCPWSAGTGSRSRLDFAGPEGCPGRRRGAPRTYGEGTELGPATLVRRLLRRRLPADLPAGAAR